MALTVGELVGYLKLDNSDWRRNMAEADRDVQKSSRWGGVLSTAAKAVGVAAGGAIAYVATMGIRTAANLQQADVAFTTLLGSGQKAEAFLDSLSKFAAATPFELPGLIDASRQLIGVGESAEKVIPTLTAWGDTAGALGLSQDQFSRAMLAVTQSMSKGKVQAEELMQITEAGIPIWPLLSKAMGKTVPELQAMAQKGDLLASDVFPALEAQMGKDYGGAMARQSATLTGVWSTLMDTINIGAAKALQPLIPLLSVAIPQAAAFLTKVFAGAGTGIAGLIGWAQRGSRAGGGLSTAWGRVWAILRPILTGFGHLAVTVFGIAVDFVERHKATFLAWGQSLAAGAQRISGYLSALFTALGDWLADNRELFLQLGDSAVVVIGALGRLVAQGGAVVDWLREHQTLLKATIATVGTITGAVMIYNGVVKGIAAVTKAWTLAQAALNVIMSLNPVGILILAVLGLVAAFITAYNSSETFRDRVKAVIDAVSGAWSWAWTNVLSPVFTAFGAAFDWLKNAGVNMALVIVRGLEMLVSFYLGMVEVLVTGAAKAFGWIPGIGPKLQDAATAVAGFRDSANASLGGIERTLEIMADPSKAQTTIAEWRTELASHPLLVGIRIAGVTGAGGLLEGLDLPGHADGAYVTGPHVAVVGEGQRGAGEWVLPDRKLAAFAAEVVHGVTGARQAGAVDGEPATVFNVDLRDYNTVPHPSTVDRVQRIRSIAKLGLRSRRGERIVIVPAGA